MILYPAIDIRDGKVVRLHKGDFAEETVYGDDPASVAADFQQKGAHWIHVVDLDAARLGVASNLDVIRKITQSVSIPIQCGGGVRDYESAKTLIDAGVARVVIGTAAHENPELVEELAKDFPGQIAVGLDARSGVVATRGWLESAGVSVLELVERFEQAGVAAFIVTDIERDGTLQGPDVSGLAEVLEATSVDVIASGGIGDINDLRQLAELSRHGKFLAGAISGKAIYEKKFPLEHAFQLSAGSELLKRVRPAVLSITPYISARTEGKQTEVRVFLDANENPYAPYPGDESVAKFNRYPEVQPKHLINAFAEKYEVEPYNVFLSRGSDEAIDMLVRIFCAEDKDAIALSSPSFPMYDHSARLQGARIVDVPLTDDFQLDVDGLIWAQREDPNIKIFFVASPNNPTANLMSHSALELLARAYSHQTLVVVDELYLDYAGVSSMASMLKALPNLVVLRSMSKEYSFAGERMGITLANPVIIELLNRIAAPYLLTQSSIRAVNEVLSPEGQKYAADKIERILKDRDRLRDELLQCASVRKVYPSDANFLLVQFDNATPLCQYLDDNGIKVRNRSNVPRLEGCVRISVGTSEENDELIKGIKAFEAS